MRVLILCLLALAGCTEYHYRPPILDMPIDPAIYSQAFMAGFNGAPLPAVPDDHSPSTVCQGYGSTVICSPLW